MKYLSRDVIAVTAISFSIGRMFNNGLSTVYVKKVL